MLNSRGERQTAAEEEQHVPGNRFICGLPVHSHRTLAVNRDQEGNNAHTHGDHSIREVLEGLPAVDVDTAELSAGEPEDSGDQEAETHSLFTGGELAHAAQFVSHPFLAARNRSAHIAEHQSGKNKEGDNEEQQGNRNTNLHPARDAHNLAVGLLHKAHVNAVRGRTDQGSHAAD